MLFSSAAAALGAPGRGTTRRRTRSSTRWPPHRQADGPARGVAGLGPVGAGQRDDRPPERRGPGPDQPRRDDRPGRRGRPGAARPGRRQGRGAAGADPAGPGRAAGAGRPRRGAAAAVARPGGRPGAPARRRAGTRTAAGALRARLAAMAEAERDRLLLDLVRAHAAAVLGHASPETVEAGPRVQGPRLRLADRGRAAQPAGRGHRAAAARHAGLRLPHPGGAGRASCAAELLGERQPAAGAGAGAGRPRPGEPVAIVGMGCRFPAGCADPGGPVGAAGVGDRRDRPGSRPTGAGTWTACSTPTRITRGPPTPARAGSWHDAGGVRRGVLRDHPAGGAGDGPAAAAAAGGVLGGAGARRDRPGVAARHRRPACSSGAASSGYGSRPRTAADGRRATC